MKPHHIFFTITSSVVTSKAHVQIISPPSIIDSDYQYTFARGVCAGDTCDAFCGDSDPNPTITSVHPDEASNSIDVRLLVSVRHRPFKYRLSLHDGDIGTISGFDTTVLAENIELESKMGWTSVQLPEDVKCDPYCVLQLYDYYYFVSCAKIRLAGGDPEETNSIPAKEETIGDIQMSDVESEYVAPIIFQEEVLFQNTPAVRVTMSASPDYLTYLALGISSEGGMVGSTAIVGSIGSVHESDNTKGGMITESGVYDVENTTTLEYFLGGKFSELVTPTPGDEKIALMSNFSINYWEYGKMNHTLEVIIRKETKSSSVGSICGKKIIWAHSSPANPSMVLAYHGIETRGVHSAPVMCEDPEGSLGDELTNSMDVDEDPLGGEGAPREDPVSSFDDKLTNSDNADTLLGEAPSDTEPADTVHTTSPTEDLVSPDPSSSRKSVRSTPLVASVLAMIVLRFAY